MDYEATKSFLGASPELQEAFVAMDSDGYDTRKTNYISCSCCGQGGYAGSYPFSTISYGEVCDDCL